MNSAGQRLYFDKDPIKDISDALSLYPKREFYSPTRSTVPLLSLLKDANRVFEKVLHELKMNVYSDLHLEYTVKSPMGKGKASHTDLMVRETRRTLAIEAKWTEPRHETVAKWGKRGKSPENKERVLKGWLQLIQPHASRKLDLDDFSGIIYQMVHRAASACYESEKPNLAYLHFVPDPSGKGATATQYESDLELLRELMGKPNEFGIYLIEVNIKQTPAFEKIKDLPKSTAETATVVRNAFENGPLFDFSDLHLQDII